QFKDNLQTSSRFLKVSIDDELEIKHENIVLLPSAFSEDINSDLNIQQRWHFDYLYNELTNNWKSIDELGQGLLMCKTLHELSTSNELKDIAKKIIIMKSATLLNEGKLLLDGELEKQKQLIISNGNMNNADIYLKQFIQQGKSKLEDLTTRLVREANDEYDNNTQKSYFIDMKERISKNIEPSVRCNQQLLVQRFEEDSYTIAQTNAITHAQKQLLDSAKQYFDKETRTKTDINELENALNKRHDELVKEFQQSLNSFKKSQNDVTQTILSNYNRLVEGRRGTALKTDIYNRCPPLDINKYHSYCNKLSMSFDYIRAYLSNPGKDEKKSFGFDSLFNSSNSNTKRQWENLRINMDWFVDHRDDDKNKSIFKTVVNNLIPQLNQNILGMLLTLKLSYSDPQTITSLISHVDNAMNDQTSCIQQNFKDLNIVRMTRDLIVIALRLLIEEAIKIVDLKDKELRKVIDNLDKWKQDIKDQFIVMGNSSEQGRKFKQDLEQQIILEVVRIYKQKTSDAIGLNMSTSTHIEAEKIARSAYDESIGSQPPNGDNILKYVYDINRYYLEIALEKVQLSKDNIVNDQISKLKIIMNDCIKQAINVVKENQCRNVKQVYKEIAKQLDVVLPGFTASEMIAIAAEIGNPDQFIQAFRQIESSQYKMEKQIDALRPEFDDVAIESCETTIRTRLGCQIRCPNCGAKCDNPELIHENHRSTEHIAMAFKGVMYHKINTPTLELCYQQLQTSAFILGSETFTPRRKYYEARAPGWLDDLDSKYQNGALRSESHPPSEQRRAWMAVRNVLVAHYEMTDHTSYDNDLYPSSIHSLPSGYTPKWK
ncbi:unnamed protein product, partial [Didymodactylos carnosus]